MNKSESWLQHYLKIVATMPFDKIDKVADMLLKSNQIVFAGNGGSYGNATHMAGDILINTPYKGNTCALGDNLVAFSALSNDISYEQAMSAEYKRRHKEGTVLVLLSTSGRSKNIIALAKTAKELGTQIVLITGKTPDILLSNMADEHIVLDSADAGMLESAYDFIGHLIIKVMC